MHRYYRSIGTIAFSFVALALFVVLGTSSVHAASPELSSEQRQHIRSECTQIKGSLSQLHASDALLRVNRGQVYESMTSKLMTPFNTRLSTSGLDNKAMTTHTLQYQSALVAFRNDYILYEQKTSEALRIDCGQEPARFYQAILDARDLRSTVHDDVQKLHRIINDYGDAVGDFLLNYKRLAN
ncbi:hypothetical protein KI440_00480 [Candidatus Saccharibacteria bacterium TM7i]|nr:hypothetical protein KI440_00480 [Candidatus Saccharibacteria bacterium TM7i]